MIVNRTYTNQFIQYIDVRMNIIRDLPISRLPQSLALEQSLPQRFCSRTRNGSAFFHNKLGGLITCRISKNAEVQQGKLENLLGWLVANGAKGVKDNPKISLFLSGDGERGVIATRNASKGEILFQVPIKLAIIDEEEEEQSTIPWSARLASKILALKAAGADCPWSAYVESLPEYMNNPTSPEFPYSDIQAVAYDTAREDIDFSIWVASSSYKSLSEQGLLPEGTLFEDFCLFLNIVHSRTFSIASKERRDGVIRLCMPLVDMLNHSGDVDIHMSDCRQPNLNAIATDACRWDCVPKIGGELILCVSAVRDIVQGEEITLSYGERSNDDFFIHYGFVPPRNPHDTVFLFKSLNDALIWSVERLGDMTTEELSSDFLTRVYENILVELDSMDPLAHKETSHLEFVDSKRVREDLSKIKLQSKGRVDERFARLLEQIYRHISDIAGCTIDEFIRNLIALRSFEILLDMKNRYGVDILSDLNILVPTESGLDEEDVLAHQFSTMLSTYGPTIRASSWWSKLSSTENVVEDMNFHNTENNDDMNMILSNFEGYNIVGEVTDTSLIDRPMDSETGNTLPIIYRLYKQLILWDSLLLC